MKMKNMKNMKTLTFLVENNSTRWETTEMNNEIPKSLLNHFFKNVTSV